MSELGITLSDAVLEEIAARAAALVLERLTPPAASEYLNVDEAAELLRAKPQRVYDLLSSRRLTRFKDGSRVLLRRAEIEAHLVGEAATAYADPDTSMARQRRNAPGPAPGGQS